jgi:glycosyltransferase involved in cell wall biosynthesis
MFEKLTISVIALCYNHSNFVIETLQSISDQNIADLEVLVIDDHSEDDSFDKISKWINTNRFNWRYIRNSRNQGVSKTLNSAVQQVNGDFIKFISCDDILLPNAILNLHNFFKQQTQKCGMVFGDMEVINESGTTISTSYLEDTGFSTDMLKDPLFLNLSKKCFVPAPSTMLRRSVFNQIKFNEELLFEDWDFWLQLSKSYSFAFDKRPIVKYRRLQNSLFHSLTPAFRNSLMTMAFKNLHFNSDADFYFKKLIIDNAMIHYIHRGPDASLWMWRRFKYTRRLRDLYYYFKALLIH